MSWPPETHDGTTTTRVPVTDSYLAPGRCGWDLSYGVLIDLKVDCYPDAFTHCRSPGGITSYGPLKCPGASHTVWESTVALSIVDILRCPPGYTYNGGDEPHGGVGLDCNTVVSSGYVFIYTSYDYPFDPYNADIKTSTISDGYVLGRDAIRGRNMITGTTAPMLARATSTPISNARGTDTGKSFGIGITAPLSGFTSVMNAIVIVVLISITPPIDDQPSDVSRLLPSSFNIPNGTATPPDTGLSKGTRIGIGVGVPLSIIRHRRQPFMSRYTVYEKTSTAVARHDGPMELPAEVMCHEMPG
ncbi:hypothetical protein EJ05DRAFT_485227 [Pseudovirgaria hyperparasitica]|uniref:Uncharacterized protein n=1 Tax=Pseudovirgaria hyperparasitica TaxID=470096 RepID=A0A6A6WC72_9PEZI|nr:uncharacterized protein EJ05DRAFT_485227 [Pseudovirgaria hyperparasitica]KAF2759167.1 hypothetical protein EJ05DRAFT_485227 [Pseudovirgaria hyperparasitica]